jgi:hypothetical protein
MPSSPRRSYNADIRAKQKNEGIRRVNVTLSPEEHARFELASQAQGERVTTHLKQCALAYLDQRYLVPPRLEEQLDEFIAIMRGIGNNLNQLARHSNEMRYFLDTNEVRLQLRRMEDEVRAFVTTPPRKGTDDQ